MTNTSRTLFSEYRNSLVKRVEYFQERYQLAHVQQNDYQKGLCSGWVDASKQALEDLDRTLSLCGATEVTTN